MTTEEPVGSSILEDVLPPAARLAPVEVPSSTSTLPYLWMLLGSFCFAVMSALAHGAGRSCDWQIVATARTALALVFAAGLVFGAKRQFVFFRPRVLWMRSIAGSVSLLCGFFALAHMPVANVLTLSNMYPLWVAVLSWPMLGVMPRARVWVAVVCGLAGVILLQQPQYVAGNYVWIAAVLASFTSAIALIGLHKLHGIDARAIVVHFSAVSLLFSIAALFVFPHSASLFSKFDGMTLLMLLGVGAAATAGQLFLTKAFAEGEPSKVAVVGLSQVGFGMLLDMIFLGRSFDLITMIGIAMIVTPTAWVMIRRAR